MATAFRVSKSAAAIGFALLTLTACSSDSGYHSLQPICTLQVTGAATASGTCSGATFSYITALNEYLLNTTYAVTGAAFTIAIKLPESPVMGITYGTSDGSTDAVIEYQQGGDTWFAAASAAPPTGAVSYTINSITSSTTVNGRPSYIVHGNFSATLIPSANNTVTTNIQVTSAF